MNSQIILILIFFCLTVLALAFYTKSTGGLFLARNPLRPADYEPSKENEAERLIGLLFVKHTFRIVGIALPILLILYPSLLAKIIGVIIAGGITIQLVSANRY